MNAERTPLFYMANLGSEVERIFSLKKKGMDKEAESAYTRALKIVDKLLEHPELSGRTGELELLKNYLEESFKNEQTATVQKEWRNYFLPYATKLLVSV